MKANPTFVIKNNTPVSQDLSVFNNTGDQGVINQTREFRFNMQCEGFSGTNNVRIRSKLNSESVYTTYNVPISDPDLQNTVTALNTLGIGEFISYTEDDVPYISVYNNERQYTSLQLLNLAGLSADADYEAFITENNTGSTSIYANCVLIQIFPYPVTNSSNWNHPYGTKIRVVIEGGDNPNPSNYIMYNIESPEGSLVNGSVAPGETFEYSFVIDKPSTLFNYRVTISDSV